MAAHDRLPNAAHATSRLKAIGMAITGHGTRRKDRGLEDSSQADELFLGFVTRLRTSLEMHRQRGHQLLDRANFCGGAAYYPQSKIRFDDDPDCSRTRYQRGKVRRAFAPCWKVIGPLVASRSSIEPYLAR